MSIDDYPTSNGSNWGDGNSNVSYYPFKVFVTEDANLQPNDYVDIQYQKDTSAEESGSSLYLQSMFIRTDNGKSYVMAGARTADWSSGGYRPAGICGAATPRYGAG